MKHCPYDDLPCKKYDDSLKDFHNNIHRACQNEDNRTFFYQDGCCYDRLGCSRYSSYIRVLEFQKQIQRRRNRNVR